MTTDPEWREFEKLVAQIEEALAPRGAVVTSPDRVKDLVTGRAREVDASIRMQVGSSPILITIECRKRSSTQDDTWIEQLATKRAKIGADKTIAVSSSGFSESAHKTARLYGIELRTLTDRIGEEIVQRFLGGLKVEFIVSEYEARSVAFILEDGSSLAQDEFGEDLLAALEQEGSYAVLATEAGTGRVITADSILQRKMEEVLTKSSPVTATVALSFEGPTIQVSTTTGPRTLRRIEISAEFRQRVVPAPATNLWEYASDEGPIRRTMQAGAPISDDETIRLTVDLDSPALDRRDEASDAGGGEDA